MEQLFLKLVHMSITAGWLVLAIVVLRLIFRRAPGAMWCVLWGMVALRLLCPVSLESPMSLIPDAPAQTVIRTEEVSVLPDAPVIPEPGVPAMEAGTDPSQIWLSVLSRIWVLGVAAMTFYTGGTYLRFRRRLAEAVPLGNRVWSCDRVDTPFILGIIKPRIYLPYSLSREDEPYVLAHEQAHLRRKDHWWKPLGFALLSVYWFNPLMWVAYRLLCRDIELACDEKVMKTLGPGNKKSYSAALIRCSISRQTIAACPLAFGEGDVKERVKAVLRYKKPAFWVIVLAIAGCLVLGLCFLTDPAGTEPPEFSDVYRFDWLEKTDADTVVLTNLHNGGKTTITDPRQVEEILSFLSRIYGRFPESGKGYSEGSYELSIQADHEILSMAFGDSDAFYTGNYGDGYPIRYHYYGMSTDKVIRFFDAFDQSNPTILDARIEAGTESNVELSVQVVNPGCLFAVVKSDGEHDWFIDDFSLEARKDSGWEGFETDRGISDEKMEGADAAANLFGMDDLPVGRYRVLVKVSYYDDADQKHSLILPAEFDIVGETQVPGRVPLEYLPQPYTLKDAAMDGCLVVGGTTVLSNEVVWDAFLESAEAGETAFPIRVVLSDTGHEDSVPSQIFDLTLKDGVYRVYELRDGEKTETQYNYLQKAASGNGQYCYLLTNSRNPVSADEAGTQVVFRQGIDQI